MVETNSAPISRTAFINPFPFILLLILLLMSLFLSDDVHAIDNDIFCSAEEIQNFEDMGISKSSIFYFLSDGKIYNVYDWFDDEIYYDDVNNSFSVNQNYLTYGILTEDGRGSVEGYSPQLNMYDFKDACILHISDMYDIKVKNKTDTYLTSNGLELINGYTACPNDNSISLTLCCLLVFLSQFLVFVKSNALLIILISASVFVICINLFTRTKGGVIR